VTAANALLLAEVGQTGPLALLDVEDHFATQGLVADLGNRLHVTRSYFKSMSAAGTSMRRLKPSWG
jgi:hypothetical protein